MEDLLSKLKQLLEIAADDASKDFKLTFTLETVITEVKNHCNIEDIPEGLNNVILQIAEDHYRTKYASELPQVAQTIQSVKRGDVETKLGSAKAAVEAGPGASFVQNYTAQLNSFRKLRW
jgi:hypothetical protein